MSNFSLGLSLFGAMLTLMILRVPISVAMFLPGAVGYWLLAGDASLLNHLKGATYARFSNYDLSVIPLFILMGQFATQGGLSRSLFKFASSLIGHLRGGVAMAAMVSESIGINAKAQGRRDARRGNCLPALRLCAFAPLREARNPNLSNRRIACAIRRSPLTPARNGIRLDPRKRSGA